MPPYQWLWLVVHGTNSDVEVFEFVHDGMQKGSIVSTEGTSGKTDIL